MEHLIVMIPPLNRYVPALSKMNWLKLLPTGTFSLQVLMEKIIPCAF